MFSISQLLITETKERILAKALKFAASVGLSVSTWEDGDPTRSLYGFMAETLETLEKVVSGYANAAFLESASGTWLKVLAEQVYGYTPREATYATCSGVLRNHGGGFYSGDPGDLVFAFSGKTYRNTTSFVLPSGVGQNCPIEIVADEPGKDSSAGVGDITTMVTTLGDVTFENTAPAVGTDAEDDESIKRACRGTRKAMSPANPRGRFAFIATNSELTGLSTITRATESNQGNGKTLLYIAGTNGTATLSDVATVRDTIAKQGLPNGMSIDVRSSVAYDFTVTTELVVYDDIGLLDGDIRSAVSKAINAFLETVPIGGTYPGFGSYRYIIKEQLRRSIVDVFPKHFFDMSLPIPSGDVTIMSPELCPFGGAHTITIKRVQRP